MNQESPSPPLAAFEIRMAAHLSIGLMVDIADLGRGTEPLLDGLLLAAVVNANVSPVSRDPALQAAFARLDRPPPDSLRRPVSINAVAESLGLPFETVRRHIRKLVDGGTCSACGEGVYVPGEVLSSPRFMAALKARYERVARFHRELTAMDAIEPTPVPLLPVDDPRAPVRAVGRILSDYFFRTLDSLHGRVRDPMSGLILLQVLQASAEQIPPPELVGILQAGRIPDEQRTPVRTAEVARRLRLPYETTRRHIGWLLEDGLCRRTDDGVLVVEAALARPEMQALLHANLTNVRRMFRGLAALRVDA